MWTTKKFAEDVMWLCKRGGVDIQPFVESLNSSDCPSVVAYWETEMGLGDIEKAPHFKEMAHLWRLMSPLMREKRITLLRRYLRMKGMIEEGCDGR